MVDYLVSNALDVMLALLAVAVYWMLLTTVLPGTLLQNRFLKGKIGDRGIRKYAFPGGVCAVFEPEVPYRPYLKQYALYCKDGQKYLQCMVYEKVTALSYDVVVFDARGKMTDVIAVSDRVPGNGYTRPIFLPGDTALVSVVLRQVDGMYRNKAVVAGCPLKNLVLCGAAVLASTLALGWVLYRASAPLVQRLGMEQISLGAALARSFGIGLLAAALVLGIHYIKGMRVMNQ